MKITQEIHLKSTPNFRIKEPSSNSVEGIEGIKNRMLGVLNYQNKGRGKIKT